MSSYCPPNRSAANVRRMERTPNSIRRAARSAPTAELDRVAAAAGTSARSVAQKLRSLNGRGRCAALLVAASGGLGAVRLALAVGSSRCPPSMVRLAALHKSPRVKAAGRGASGWMGRTRQHPAAPCRALAATVAAICETVDVKAFKALVAQGHCSRALLTRLAGDERLWVREAVATSSSLPAWSLAALTLDESEWPRRAAATNPNCASAHLWRLARDDKEIVRGAARAALWERQ